MVCFLDEKDLVKESLLVAGNASTDIIRMGNVFPNVLHMAGIEQKGNVYFRSKIVLCTSNVENSMEGAQQSVRFPEAVTNRFHFEIVVRVAREFALEEDLSLPQEHWRLDHSKLPLSGVFEPRVHEYIILKRVRDVSRPNEVILEKSRVLNFEELLIECAKKFRELERIAGKVLTDDVRSFEYGSKIRNKVMKAQMDEDQTPFLDAYDKPLSEGNFAEFNILIDALDSVKDPEMAYRAYYSLKEDERNVSGKHVRVALHELDIALDLVGHASSGEKKPTRIGDLLEECFHNKIPLAGLDRFKRACVSNPLVFRNMMVHIHSYEFSSASTKDLISNSLERLKKLSSSMFFSSMNATLYFTHELHKHLGKYISFQSLVKVMLFLGVLSGIWITFGLGRMLGAFLGFSGGESTGQKQAKTTDGVILGFPNTTASGKSVAAAAREFHKTDVTKVEVS